MQKQTSVAGGPPRYRPDDAGSDAGLGPVSVAGLSNWQVLASYLALGGLGLSPLLWTDIPPLIDYPSHLARMAILAARGASLNYVVHWQLIPNLAMDLVVPPLSALIGLETAGKLFIAATLALLVAGTTLLHRALFGRAGLWPLASLLFVYNFALFFGFLNFLFGLGLALLGFAGWIASRHWPLGARLAAFAMLATVIFICHLFAFGVYGLLVGSYEIGLLLADRPISGRAIRRSAALAVQFVPAISLWLANPSAGEPHTTDYGDFADKFVALAAPMNSQAFGGMLAPIFFGLAYLAWRHGAVRVAPSMRTPMLVLTIAAIAMPNTLYGSWLADIRLPITLAFIGIASLQPQRSHHRLAGPVAIALIGLIALRIAAITLAWHAMAPSFDEFRAVTRTLPRGIRLLTAQQGVTDQWRRLADVPSWFAERDSRFLHHIGNLAILDRDVFVPNLGLQLAPVEPAARNVAISGPSSPPISIPMLIGAADEIGGPLFWQDWPHKYDYLLLIDYGDHTNPLPDRLTNFAQGSFFTYYKITP